MPVGGVYGFLSVGLRVHSRYGGKVAVAWEGRRNFRVDLYPSYKGRDRPPDPERLEIIQEMIHQERLLIGLLRSMGVRQYRGVNCEADDVIGRLATIGKRCRATTIVYSGDSDLRQLVGSGTYAVSPGKSSDTLYNEQQVVDKHGVPPVLIAEYKALSGDSSDNIPGISGVGPKTAAALLNHYGALRAVCRAAKDGDEGWPVAERFRASIRSGAEDLRLYLKLTRIRTDAPWQPIRPKRSQGDLLQQLRTLKFRTLAAPAELHGLMNMGK